MGELKKTAMDPELLILIALLLLVPFAAIAAFIMALMSRQDIKTLRRQIDDLQQRRRELQARMPEASAAPPPQKAAAPQTTPQTTAQAAAQPTPQPTAAPPPPPPPPPPDIPSTVGKAEDGEASGASRLVLLLQALYLYPPSKAERGEAGVGAWFATRMGILIGVIAAVFFGMYVAQDTPAWLRWLSLLGVSSGIALLGLWLEKRSVEIAPFGRVLFAGGLSMIYLCSYAAYGFEPIRIVHSEAAGVLLQVIAVVLILLASLWRRRESIAILALLFGYFSCVFSFLNLMDDYALAGAILLALWGGYLGWRQGWWQALTLSLGGTWLITGLVMLNRAIRDFPPAPSLASALVILSGMFGLFLFLHSRRDIFRAEFTSTSQRLFHLGNSAALLAIGWGFTFFAYRDQLEVFYTVAAVLMLVAWLWFLRTDPYGGISTTYLIKASSLISLAVVAAFTGEVRWLGILAQAACLAYATKRNPHQALDYFFYLVIALAATLYLYDISADGAVAAINPLIALLFLLVLGLVLAVRRRFLAGDKPSDDPAIGLSLLAQLLAGLTAIAFLNVFHEGLSGILYALGLALFFAGTEALPAANRRWFIPSALTALYAYFVFLLRWPHDAGMASTLLAGSLLVALGCAAAWQLAHRLINLSRGRGFAEGTLHLLGILILTLTLFRTVPESSFYFAAMLAVWAALGCGIFLRMPKLALLSATAFPIALLLFAYGSWTTLGAPLSWITALMGMVYMLFLAHRQATMAGGAGATARKLELHAWFGGGMVAIPAFLIAVYSHVPSAWIPLVLGSGALALSGVWRLWKPWAWAWLVVVLAILSHLAVYSAMFFAALNPTNTFPGGGIAGFVYQILLPSILPLLAALVILAGGRKISDHVASHCWALVGSASLALIFFGATQPPFELLSYATVIWGLSAIALFVFGLTARLKPLRLVALAGLGAAIIRLFVHDVQDVLLRIIAFAALGVVLLIIGYLYHRYKDRIEG